MLPQHFSTTVCGRPGQDENKDEPDGVKDDRGRGELFSRDDRRHRNAKSVKVGKRRLGLFGRRRYCLLESGHCEFLGRG